jgi:DNA replication protein DnaC
MSRAAKHATSSSLRERVRTQLADLKMPGALEALDDILRRCDSGQLAAADAIEQLLGAHIQLRNARRLQTAMRSARLPVVKTLADFDFSFQPSVKRDQIESLHTLGFIERKENVVLLGPPGVGKTPPAVALGGEAILAGHSVRFTSAAAVAAQLAKAQADGRLEDKLAHFAKPKCLIIDEPGYLPFEPAAAHLFFQLISRRYERGAILITSNRSVGEWGTVFGDAVVATAILDRLLHHSHVFTIRGDSYRPKEKRRSGLLPKTGTVAVAWTAGALLAAIAVSASGDTAYILPLVLHAAGAASLVCLARARATALWQEPAHRGRQCSRTASRI